MGYSILYKSRNQYDIYTVSFTDLDQGREILSRFSLPKSMKHSVVPLNLKTEEGIADPLFKTLGEGSMISGVGYSFRNKSLNLGPKSS